MLMIRLQRVGRKNDPSFRVVVVDSREAAQTGKVIEVVGSHDARVDRTELKTERIRYWLSMGAKASNTVNNLLIKKGVITGSKIDVSSDKKLSKKVKAPKAKEVKVEEIKEEIPSEEVKEKTLTEKID